MTKLTGKERDGLPTSAFAVPLRRAYPIQNPSHARSALSMVAAHGTASERKSVRDAVSRRYPSIKNKGETP
jgi:hypothetical protein